ncbi:MAG: FKBP-type peptidyl-prolyl cis-trans isomerase [Actinomycetaceae bacterium]|nr:FKBP-type peptidyl-prolyl cis-trans isomerase [Actinomycetaceae bacterium]
MKAIARLFLVAISSSALALAGCTAENDPNAQETNTPSADASAAAETVVNRDYDGPLPEVGGEFAKSVSVKPVSAQAPDTIVAKTVIQGDGEEVPSGAAVAIHYHGVLWDDGSIFDSTFERGGENPQPVVFELGRLIEGWQLGLAGQHVGDRVELVVPAKWGYGDHATEKIPANSTLVFVIDITGVMQTSDISNLKGATPTNEALPDGVSITGELGADPQLELSDGYKAPEAIRVTVLSTGTGEKINEADYVAFHATLMETSSKSKRVTWENGEPLVSPQPVGDTPGVVGQTLGSRVMVETPVADGESQIIIYDLISALRP